MNELTLLSPSVRADPYPYYANLRREAPVQRLDPFGLWAISRYDEVLHVVKHPEIFSSSAMRTLAMGGISMAAGSGQMLEAAELAQSDTLIAADPPRHTRLRNLVNRAFTPRRIAALEPRMREIAAEALDPCIERGDLELVRDLSTPLPVRVIAELLGVPASRFRDFKRWSDALVTSISTTSADVDVSQLMEARRELVAFLVEQVAEAQRSPRDNLLGALVRAQADEGVLTEAEAVSFGLLLLVAGNETTTNLIGNALLALLEHPDQLGRVQSDPSLIPNLIEEALRYDSPVQGLLRRTSRDVETAGTKIPEGEPIMILFASANRDERQFAEPDRFDITRDTRGHLAFGFGIHFCLGASLARLEARVALEAILSRCRDLHRLDSGPVRWIDSLLLRGPRELHLGFTS